MRARAAESAGASALGEYRAALALAPDDAVLAARAMEEAIAGGDRALALKAVAILEAADKMTIDAQILLLGEAFRKKDWRGASRRIDAIEATEAFAFLVPTLRAWRAQGEGGSDPLTYLAADNVVATAYSAEQRPLILFAQGKSRDGLAALAPLLAQAGTRGARLRIASAAALARRGAKAEALALLEGDAEALAAARRLVEAGRRLPGEIATPNQGMAELLIRVAIDLSAQNIDSLAIQFARLATFLAPENSEGWIVAAELLSEDGDTRAALAALARVSAADPFAGLAGDSRIDLLYESGKPEEALAVARAATAAAPDAATGWARLGDLLARMQRHGDAAEAYGKALAIARGGGGSVQQEWALLLLQGGALVQAGRWPEGRDALRASLRLAPDQAVVLNYLGYSLLERREEVAEAERLIREANRLQPDNYAIVDSLGWAHYLRGDYLKAIELLERAAQGQPSDPAIKEHLGDAYFQAGRRYEARYAWSAALIHAEGNAARRIGAKVEKGLRPELGAP